LGSAGAPGMNVGVVPGTAVESRGLVAELVAFATIDAKGTAVGFVASKGIENDVVGVGVPVMTVVPEAVAVMLPGAACVLVPDAGGLGEPWRASRWRA